MINKQEGILLWYKNKGLTSFQALKAIKKYCGTNSKIGHTGTLDKMAQGLQIVLIGSYTRLNPLLSHLDKEYTATLDFGYETTTLDAEGTLTQQAPLPLLKHVQKALEEIQLGSIWQTPPVYSAIHVNGKRAYQYARTGIPLSMKNRLVLLHKVKTINIEINNNFQVKKLTISISCGSGFYVRSFIRDLAYACKSVATLTYLERTGIGNYAEQWAFQVADAINQPEHISAHILNAQNALIRLKGIQLLTIKPEYEQYIATGKTFKEEFISQKAPIEKNLPSLLINDDGSILAQTYYENGWRYQFVASKSC